MSLAWLATSITTARASTIYRNRRGIWSLPMNCNMKQFQATRWVLHSNRHWKSLVNCVGRNMDDEVQRAKPKKNSPKQNLKKNEPRKGSTETLQAVCISSMNVRAVLCWDLISLLKYTSILVRTAFHLEAKDHSSTNCLARKHPGIGNQNYKERLCKRLRAELPSFSLIPRRRKCHIPTRP